MNFRDEAALRAMEGLLAACANPSTPAWLASKDYAELAIRAYQIADAMNEERYNRVDRLRGAE